ncbi:MAG TPA: two-component regulator propeller domain-containing protein, partial [Trichocoleus sp.]
MGLSTWATVGLNAIGWLFGLLLLGYSLPSHASRVDQADQSAAPSMTDLAQTQIPLIKEETRLAQAAILNRDRPTDTVDENLTQPNPAADYRVPALQPDYTGSLWVGSWQGLARISPQTGQVLARINLPSRTIGALAQDRVGRVWVGTYEGLIRVDP